MDHSARGRITRLWMFWAAGMVAGTASAALAQTRDAPPTAKEAEAALVLEKEYHDSFGAIVAINGCVPAAWEDSEVSTSEINWWCMAEARKANGETSHDSIGFQRLPGNRRFTVLVGEYVGMCPPGKDVSAALKSLVRKSGVTGILDATNGQPGHFEPSEHPAPDGRSQPVFACDYYGRWKNLNYILHVSMVYDRNRYSLVGGSFEELFDEDGRLVDEDGRPTGQ